MLPISEIQENYKKIRTSKYLVGLGLSIFTLIFILIIFNVIPGNYSIVLLLPVTVVFIIVSFSPELSTFELIRYHLSRLLESLNEKKIKESVNHLDKLAYNLENFNHELEDSFILLSSKKTLNEFWKLLKNQVYPSLLEKDFESYTIPLTDIESAIENENITQLNEELNKFKSEKVDTDSVLPYEKPPILNRIINSISSKIQINFQKNFIFRLVCISVLVLSIGYFISTKTSFVLDNTIIGVLILVALAIAKEYN